MDPKQKNGVNLDIHSCYNTTMNFSVNNNHVEFHSLPNTNTQYQQTNQPNINVRGNENVRNPPTDPSTSAQNPPPNPTNTPNPPLSLPSPSTIVFDKPSKGKKRKTDEAEASELDLDLKLGSESTKKDM